MRWSKILVDNILLPGLSLLHIFPFPVPFPFPSLFTIHSTSSISCHGSVFTNPTSNLTRVAGG